MEGSNQEAKGSKRIARGSKYKGSGRLLRKRKAEIIICDFLKGVFYGAFIRPRGRAEPCTAIAFAFTLMLWIRRRCLRLAEGEAEAQWGWPPGCPDSVVCAARVRPGP